jgi:hypothetical protein
VYQGNIAAIQGNQRPNSIATRRVHLGGPLLTSKRTLSGLDGMSVECQKATSAAHSITCHAAHRTVTVRRGPVAYRRMPLRGRAGLDDGRLQTTILCAVCSVRVGQYWKILPRANLVRFALKITSARQRAIRDSGRAANAEHSRKNAAAYLRPGCHLTSRELNTSLPRS